MRNTCKVPEAFLDEAKSVVTSMDWALGKVIGQERLEQAYPIKSNEPQRYSNVTSIVARVPGRAIGNPAQDAQQGQLVGRRFVVVEDDMPD
jgi:hypothetical protein